MKLERTKQTVYRIIWPYLFIAIGISSCVAQRSLNNSEDYHEDLSALRPVIPTLSVDTSSQSTSDPLFSIEDKNKELVAYHQVNSTVDEVLDSIDRFNSIKRSVDGFTIQIYSGNRADAGKTQAQMLSYFSDVNPNLTYSQPNWQVTAGQFYTKLEAQKDLTRIRKEFPNAFLIPSKIPIR